MNTKDKTPNEALSEPLQQCNVIRWLDANEELPLCVSTGNWDGKQSDIVLAETSTGKKFLAQCYEGFMDGNAFFDWCQVDEVNGNDWLITETVSRWMKIPF
jgi:hypothetical protein